MSTILYGKCITARESVEVRISELADHGCALETDGFGAMADSDVSLWIGAIGPFPARATRRDARHLALRFTQPLDSRIVDHFCG